MLSRVLLFLVMIGTPIWAVEPGEILDDPVLEERARSLSKELRCLVCRNESIDDSNATLAKDLRLLVRERLVAGDSDAETMTYIVDRYGEFVLLRPTMGGHNLILWLAGPALLFLGLLAVVMMHRNRLRSKATAIALSDDEKARLKSLLDE